MRMNKQAIITLLAAAAVAMIAGCGTSMHSGDANAAGANSTMSSASQDNSKMPAASPYSQPLMATGGDLVMLRIAPGVAG